MDEGNKALRTEMQESIQELRTDMHGRFAEVVQADESLRVELGARVGAMDKRVFNSMLGMVGAMLAAVAALCGTIITVAMQVN